jgi:glycosyltransferase involved in cell wall biosynthesis
MTTTTTPTASRPVDRPTVMQVVLSLNPGGTERLVIDIVQRLHGRVRGVVCCLDEPGAWANEVTAIGIPVFSLGRAPGFQPSLARAIARLARTEGVALLHCHQYSPFVYGRLAALIDRKLRVVFTEHGRLSDAGPSTKRRVANAFLGRGSGIRLYAVSRELRSHLVAEGLPPSRVGVIYNGIDVHAAPRDSERRAARAALNVGDSTLVVGTAARLDPVKDLGTLVEAFDSFRRARPDALLAIFGDGPQSDALKQRVERLGLGEQVRFLGYRSDVRQLLVGVDVYVNTSLSEGVSLTILEAMAAGLPVIATRVGGTPEVVLDGDTGVLVPPRSSERVADALLSLGADKTRRHAMGTAGRRRAEEKFTLDRMVAEYVEVYDDLLEQCATGRGSRA